MTDITDTNMSEFHTWIEKILEDVLKDAGLLGKLDKLWAFLKECEALGIDLVNHVLHSAPLPSGKLKGDIEFGFGLYWVHNPPGPVGEFLDKHPALKELWKLIADTAPPTQITTEDYNAVKQHIKKDGGVVWQDGTIYGTGKYEQLDTGWAWSALNYVLNKLDPGSIHKFGGAPYSGPLQTLDGSSNASITIAIIGDWGTGWWDDPCGGNGPGEIVMAEAQAHQPDFLIHLGDVYYAGTDWRPPPGEERDNFLKLWPSRPAKTSFTINSNHEMYGAASGLFDIALGTNSPFSHQNQTSYFIIQNDDWAIIGLDSAYWTPSEMYMLGGIGGMGGAIDATQLNFLQGLDLGTCKVMVLTHHNPITFLGDEMEPAISGGPPEDGLYGQVVEALGRAPDVWYWGHVHDGVVYNDKTAFQGHSPNTLGRCIGHAAIPYGDPWGLKDRDTYDYYAHTPNPNDPFGLRVMNGYAILTLTGAQLTEAVYEQGNKTAVWSG